MENPSGPGPNGVPRRLVVETAAAGFRGMRELVMDRGKLRRECFFFARFCCNLDSFGAGFPSEAPLNEF